MKVDFRNINEVNNDLVHEKNNSINDLPGFEKAVLEEYCEKGVKTDEFSINIDIENDIPKAQAEMSKLIQLLESSHEVDLRHVKINYNGNNGFHLRIPAILFKGFENTAKLPQIHRAIFNKLTLGLECFDSSVYDEGRSLPKVNSYNKETNLFAIPLTHTELLSWSAEKILETAKTQRKLDYFPEEEMDSIPALVEIKQAAIPKPNTPVTGKSFSGRGDYNIFEFIRDNVTVPEVANRLGLILHKKGDKLQGNCPTGHTSEGERCFTVNTEYFHCFSCKTQGDATKLVEITKKLTSIQAVDWILDEFNLNEKLNRAKVNFKTISPEERAELEKQKTNGMLYEEAFLWMKEKLPSDEATMQYLTKDRGYKPEEIKNSEWCSFPKEKEIRDYLRSKFPDKLSEINKLSLRGQKEDFSPLAFPYRNNRGIITGFLKRATSPKGVMVADKQQRWDSTYGVSKKDIFNISNCKNTESLLVIEGYPDALMFTAMGMDNVVAVGQGNLSKSHLTAMKSRKTKYVTIAFDNDDVGPGNTEKAIMLLLEESVITPYVFEPTLLASYKDPDEYVKTLGIAAFKEQLNKIELGALWLCKRKTLNLSSSNPIEKERILRQCLDLLLIVRNPVHENEVVKFLMSAFSLKERDMVKLLKQRKEENYVESYKKIVYKDDERYFPFIEKGTGAYAYYDRYKDTVHLGVAKDIICSILASAGQALPDPLTVLTAVFDVHNDKRIDLEKEILNFFVPSEYMLYKKNSDKINPESDFRCINLLLSNLIPIEEERNLFFNWLAGILQTREKQLTAWVFKGEQGAGKGLFLTHVLKKLFGRKQAIQVEDAQLKSEFNPWLQNCMMIAFNEVARDNNSRNALNSKIKAIITDDEIMINEKNIKAIYLTNYVNCLFFSNESVPIFIEQQDRRFNVIITNGNLNKQSWFESDPVAFIKGLESEVPAFAQFLMNWEYNEINAKRVFTNEAKEIMTSSAMNRFEEFVHKLKTADVNWFKDHINSTEISEGVTLERAIKSKQIEKDMLLRMFLSIYKDTKNLTKVGFGKKMAEYGIRSVRVSVSGDPNIKISYYSWD